MYHPFFSGIQAKPECPGGMDRESERVAVQATVPYLGQGHHIAGSSIALFLYLPP
jgi:hypothetical protein